MSARWKVRSYARGVWRVQTRDDSVWEYTDTWAEAMEFIAAYEKAIR